MSRSHPLKWKDLVKQVGLSNPDVWIEDLRHYGACKEDGKEIDGELVCIDEGTIAVEASFSVIHDKKFNRIIIRHHF